MFGMGFTEILLIAVVAILFLGPDKLPDAMVQIAKFFNSVRKTVNEAKSTFEEELHIQQLREEAMNYRQSLRQETEDLAGFKHTLDRSAKELDEALQSARGGLSDLNDDSALFEEEDPEEEPPQDRERKEHQERIAEYKAMARKALEESRDLEDSPGERTEADPAKKQAKPSGFKHHKSEGDA